MAGDMRAPLVIVNYKVYANAIGRAAVDLTKRLEACASSFPGVTVAICPSHPDLHAVASMTDLVVLAQSVTGDVPGSGTGRVLPEAILDAGALGSLINHAEAQVPEAEAKAAISRLDSLRMVSVLCTADAASTTALAALRPTLLAIEPPDLIGGDVSVTTADPAVVQASVAAARAVDPKARLLCGAGVKDGNDVEAALKLGTEGVLVASGVVCAADPAQALAGLLEGASRPS